MLLMFLSACVQEVDLQLQSKLKLPSALYLDQMQNSNAQPIDFMVLDSANQSIQDAKIDSSMVEVDMHLPQIDQMLVNQDQMMIIQDQMIDDQMMMVDMMMVDMMPPIEPQFPIPPDCDENHLDACLQIGAKINELNYVNQKIQNRIITNTFIEIYNPHQYQLDEHLQVDFYRMDLVYDRNGEHYLDVNDLGSINDCLAVENHLYYTCLLSDIENNFEFSRFFDFILVILSYQNIAIDALFIYYDFFDSEDIISYIDSNISDWFDLQMPHALSIQSTNQFDQNTWRDQSISRCPLADDPSQVEFQFVDLSFGLANLCR